MDRKIISEDEHFAKGCTACHKGDDSKLNKDLAHKGWDKRPSDRLETCGECHARIVSTYGKSLHYTTAGQRNRVIERMSPAEAKHFDANVFEKSCRSCHASCGDCHVKSPVISGISVGLIQGHRFVKKDEGKTCAFCHGGRVYPEYTGEYGGTADVHYQKGMMCMDCHRKREFHGDGTAYRAKEEVRDRPSCRDCHRLGGEAKLTARIAHLKHQDKVTCFGCHASAEYRNCSDCHVGGGSEAKPGFMLGMSPKNKRQVTTLRLIPTVRDSFKSEGIGMERFDRLPNYWDTPAHNIRKRTERTRNCDACHEDRKGFLTKDKLIKDGSKANLDLLVNPKPIPISE
ncbi:MAG: hypothetical protein LLG93_03765 [Deltaproteobacteria bacterium]|nr:hypothetical protein [Deltaproteobacteria bacterium]